MGVAEATFYRRKRSGMGLAGQALERQPERDVNREGRKRAENAGANETRPKFSLRYQNVRLAGEPGFEPGLTESESVGLPLTYSPAGAREAPQCCARREHVARRLLLASAPK